MRKKFTTAIIIVAILLTAMVSLTSCGSKRLVPYKMQCRTLGPLYNKIEIYQLDSSYKVGEEPAGFTNDWIIVSRER